jgi:alpha-galactosidase
MVINWDINSREHSQPELQKYFREFKRLRPYYYGDYYPLTTTEAMTKDNVSLAYQLNRPDQNNGVIMAFRRKNCETESFTVKLHGIDPKMNYELTDEDSQLKATVSGEQLINGYGLILKNQPGSLLIWYKQTN